MPAFVNGLELNRGFYTDAVWPLVERWPHAAARIGTGSDVLGFDDERSTDHGWGPQLVLLVDEGDVDDVGAAVDAGLPDTYAGWPVRFGWDDVPVTHHVTVAPLSGWMVDRLGVDPTTTRALRPADWLSMPQQKLLEVTGGAVYHDDDGRLADVRRRLAYFPDAVWLWMLACQWRRIAQEEAFVGRTAQVGDELGSRIVAARMAREVMRLWFLCHRTYWPYTKWFGTAFRRLPGADSLAAALDAALRAPDHASREAALVEAYELVARKHNQLGVTEPVDPTARQFYGRPFRVLMADRFVGACLAALDDPELAAMRLKGSIDQYVDSTDVLG